MKTNFFINQLNSNLSIAQIISNVSRFKKKYAQLKFHFIFKFSSRFNWWIVVVFFYWRKGKEKRKVPRCILHTSVSFSKFIAILAKLQAILFGVVKKIIFQLLSSNGKQSFDEEWIYLRNVITINFRVNSTIHGWNKLLLKSNNENWKYFLFIFKAK